MIKFLASSLFIILLTTACSVLTLQPANFSWPIESILPVDDQGNVAEDRYSVEFNTKGLFFEEFKDSLAFEGKEINLIRNNEGNYFITASEFKNVYVFKANEGTLALHKKINISETALNKPAFNQRDSYIELIDGDKKFNLSSQGIIEDAGSRQEGDVQ
ncbi:MAG: hypothetical protein P8X47_13495 [Ignavibacteriaceae bacterium]